MCCSPTSLKRVHYFAGQLLTAADFAAEQEYFLERLRRHNRCCHGWGVVCGLDLGVNGAQVTVAPGMALDCYGNEIILPRLTTMPLPADLPAQLLYVLLHYEECETDPVPAVGAPCCSDTDIEQYSRITEVFELKLAVEDPAHGHLRRKGHCQPCRTAHGVSLGRLRWSKRRWRIDARYRPCQAFDQSGPELDRSTCHLPI
jgi:hypothetical protein